MNTPTSESQPLVSVIIPTYNRPKELARAIQSVLSQTYQNFEILVVDDGSEEDLKKVCDSFNDTRIRFFRNEKHTNANMARNRGIKEAKGEYIAMLDSDDEFLSHHLERRVEKIQEWDCDGIFGSAYIDNGSKRTLKLSRPLNEGELMINYLLSDGFAPTPSHFYKTSCAKEIMWDESLLRHQDFDFSVRFAEKFDFRSDYEPTTIIYWNNKEKRKEYHWKSCVSFMNGQSNKIKPRIALNYYLKNISTIISNGDVKDYKYLKGFIKEAENKINFLSFTEYISIPQISNPKNKTLQMLGYFLKLIKVLAK